MESHASRQRDVLFDVFKDTVARGKGGPLLPEDLAIGEIVEWLIDGFAVAECYLHVRVAEIRATRTRTAVIKHGRQDALKRSTYRYL